jgi:hypothetical protein
MRNLRLVTLFALAGALWTAGPAAAAGGNYVFAGGTPNEQAQVKAALDVSSFNWSLVPTQITIHIQPGINSEATVGNIWLDSRLVDSGRFAWGIVQHEYAHQVDYFLLDDAKRALLNLSLGGKAWSYDVPGLLHGQYGCERFASTLAWAYWPSAQNSMKPASSKDESAALAPAKFRGLVASVLGFADPITRQLKFAK